MRPVVAPSARAASTNSRSAYTSVLARTSRASGASDRIVRPMMSLYASRPQNDVMAMSRISAGNDEHHVGHRGDDGVDPALVVAGHQPEDAAEAPCPGTPWRCR